jgi:hypothetical protein
MTSIPQLEKLFEHELEAGGDSTKALLLGVELINARMKLEGLEKVKGSKRQDLGLQRFRLRQGYFSKETHPEEFKRCEILSEEIEELNVKIRALKGIEE